MIFLIGKIFLYLVLAGSIGGAAGWLLRNLQAQRAEESALRAAHDAKAKLPQLESLLRGRDEQILKLKEMQTENKLELSEQNKALGDLEKQLRDQQRETRRWQERAEARQQGPTDEFDISSQGNGKDVSESDALIAKLSQEIAQLKEELAKSEQQIAAKDSQAGERSDEAGLLKIELEALRTRLSNVELELEHAREDLLHEQSKVRELERERELQNNSLQVLHRQLDLERTRRVSTG